MSQRNATSVVETEIILNKQNMLKLEEETVELQIRRVLEVGVREYDQYDWQEEESCASWLEYVVLLPTCPAMPVSHRPGRLSSPSSVGRCASHRQHPQRDTRRHTQAPYRTDTREKSVRSVWSI